MINVLLVDDHASVCDSLAASLERAGDFAVAARLARADLAEVYCEKLKPDLPRRSIWRFI